MKINKDITLKPLNKKDAKKYYQLTNIDREELKEIFNSITDTSTLKDEQDFITKLTNKKENLYIYYKKTLCGKIGVYHYNKDENSYELYYYLSSIFRKKGIITKTCNYFIKYVFKKLKANIIKIYINTDNLESNKIMNKLNIKFIETIKNKDYCNNKYHDQNLYVIKKTTKL